MTNSRLPSTQGDHDVWAALARTHIHARARRVHAHRDPVHEEHEHDRDHGHDRVHGHDVGGHRGHDVAALR